MKIFASGKKFHIGDQMQKQQMSGNEPGYLAPK
jgi:hypothetical protein